MRPIGTEQIGIRRRRSKTKTENSKGKMEEKENVENKGGGGRSRTKGELRIAEGYERRRGRKNSKMNCLTWRRRS